MARAGTNVYSASGDAEMNVPWRVQTPVMNERQSKLWQGVFWPESPVAGQVGETCPCHHPEKKKPQGSMEHPLGPRCAFS
jgi:hypothetical protein